jgi:hypothetical protein
MFGLLFILKGWILFLYLPFSPLDSITATAMQGLISRRVPDNA